MGLVHGGVGWVLCRKMESCGRGGVLCRVVAESHKT